MSGGGLGFWAQAVWVVRKDLALEARLRLRTATVPSFAALMLLLFSFTAGANAGVLGVVAPGAVALTLLLCSTLAMGEAQRLEHADGVMVGLFGQGLAPSALFLGKALGNALILGALALAMGPVAYALFGLDLPAGAPAWAAARLVAAMMAGVAAVAAPGTLLAAMAQGPGRALVVPVLYYPLVVPALLACVRATQAALAGDVGGSFGAWMAILAAFSALYWPLCTFLFAHVVEGPEGA